MIGSGRMGSMMAVGAMLALSASASAGPTAMDELRSRRSPDPEQPEVYRAGRPHRVSYGRGGKAQPKWYKGSRWAKKAHRRGGNPAKHGPVN